jgi:Uma2 family endonuclease
MIAPARARMSSDEFLAWAMERPEGESYELVAGEVVAMAPERSSHALTKLRIARRLDEAVEAAGLPCTVYPDGMAVEVDRETVYEPDAMVRCGAPVPEDAVKITGPLIVVEVLSPSTRARDAGAKLEDYFRLPSVRHYLIVKTENRTVIHHARSEGGDIVTRIVRDGSVLLDPPGLELRKLFDERERRDES